MILLECILTLFYIQVERVIFCLFLDKDVEIYEKQMQLFFPRQNVDVGPSQDAGGVPLQNADVETPSSQ